MKTYADLVGDGGSDILGQVQAQRERLASRLSRIRRTVAVMSGKGGVGKSTLTANLALALAGAGLRVGVLDADLNGPCMGQILGIRGNRLALGPDGALPAEGPLGVRVMSMDLLLTGEGVPLRWKAPSRQDAHVWRQSMEATALREFLSDTAWGELDCLLVDLPPGSDRLPTLAGLVPRLAATVVVTLPTLVSGRVVHKSITAAREHVPDSPMGLVENMATYCCPACGTEGRLFPGGAEAVAQEAGIACWGRIPFDPRMADCADAGVPFLIAHAESATARAIQALAETLHRVMEVQET